MWDREQGDPPKSAGGGGVPPGVKLGFSRASQGLAPGMTDPISTRSWVGSGEAGRVPLRESEGLQRAKAGLKGSLSPPRWGVGPTCGLNAALCASRDGPGACPVTQASGPHASSLLSRSKGLIFLY